MEVLLARRPRHPALSHKLLGVSIAVVLMVRSGLAQTPTAEAPVPHYDLRVHTPAYVGPLDQPVDASTLTEIRIGYFGPSDPDHPLYGNLWRAALRAVDDANRRGGWGGKPFRLVAAWSDNPWGSGVKQIAQMVYTDHVWAIVGGVDGPTTHLAEQVVVKARLALVSPVSADKTVNLTNVPWMFSLAPNDSLVAEVLAQEIARRATGRRLVLVTTNDHDAFLLTRELRRALAARQVAPDYQFEYQPQSRELAGLARECLAARPDLLIVIANPTDSVDLVRSLRQAGFAGGIVGGPAMGREPFVRQVADATGELVFPRMNTEPAAAPSARSEPANAPSVLDDDDYAALQVYDAVHLVTSAINEVGLSRVAIAHAIRQRAAWDGLSGRIAWDAPGSNTRRPTLATLDHGRLVPLSRSAPSFSP